MRKIPSFINVISLVLILGPMGDVPVRAQVVLSSPGCLSGRIRIDKDRFRRACAALCGSAGIKRGLTQKARNFYREVAARGWDTVVPDREIRKRFTLSSWPGLINYLTDRIHNKKILSVGSGRAELESALSGHNKVVCLDAVPEMVERARAKGLSAFLGTGSMLGFADETFDLVIFPYSISLIKDVDTMLRETSRVLKKNGKILVINPRFTAKSAAQTSMADKGFYRRGEIRGLLERNGFSVKYAPKVVALPESYGNEPLEIIYIFAQKNYPPVRGQAGPDSKPGEVLELQCVAAKQLEEYI